MSNLKPFRGDNDLYHLKEKLDGALRHADGIVPPHVSRHPCYDCPAKDTCKDKKSGKVCSGILKKWFDETLQKYEQSRKTSAAPAKEKHTVSANAATAGENGGDRGSAQPADGEAPADIDTPAETNITGSEIITDDDADADGDGVDPSNEGEIQD